MAKIDIEPLPKHMQMIGRAQRTNHDGEELLRSIITERLKVETNLFTNLAMCEAQLKSFNDDFVNNCLTGHVMIEWSDRIEKLNRVKSMILELIKSKTKEWMLEKKT